MKTYNNSIGSINAFTIPIIIEWLNKHEIPYDELHIGKPWCGSEGFYVDDKAIRPSEFKNLSYTEIQSLLEREAGGIPVRHKHKYLFSSRDGVSF